MTQYDTYKWYSIGRTQYDILWHNMTRTNDIVLVEHSMTRTNDIALVEHSMTYYDTIWHDIVWNSMSMSCHMIYM